MESYSYTSEHLGHARNLEPAHVVSLKGFRENDKITEARNLCFFIISSIAMQTPGSGISNILVVGTTFTGSGNNIHWQWELILPVGTLSWQPTSTGKNLVFPIELLTRVFTPSYISFMNLKYLLRVPLSIRVLQINSRGILSYAFSRSRKAMCKSLYLSIYFSIRFQRRVLADQKSLSKQRGRGRIENAETRVRSSMGNTKFFPVEVGLHQGSAISPYLFALILDKLLRGIQGNIPRSMVFADDIVLVAESTDALNMRLESYRKALEDKDLRVSRDKIEYLRCDFGRYEAAHGKEGS
nr:retrovirus-related Pol polyprotein LINE-1 [Tanacetum cinerariifolium]